MRTLIEVFDSVGDFSRAINARPIKKAFYSYRQGKPASIDDNFSFSKTKSYEEAEDLLIHGYKEGYNNLEAIIIKNKPKTGKSIRPRAFNDVVGFAPHVPNMLAGVPQSMINVKRQTVKAKVLTLMLNLSIDCSISAESILRTNAATMSAVTSLERARYRINLYICIVTTDGRDFAGFILKIKDAGQYMDKLKMAYPLVHPSFLRRHFFRFAESADLGKVTKKFAWNYGKVVTDKKQIKSLLDERHIKIDKYISFYDAQNKSADKIADMILTKD